MTITCDRWNEIAFSGEYYRSGQKILVPQGLHGPNTLADLDGQEGVCPRGHVEPDQPAALAPKA